MAIRPVFVSEISEHSLISEINVDFQWFPGMSIIQKQKSIESLHKAIIEKGYGPVLEISSKSPNPLGVKLSSFNLKLKISDNLITTVESVYQGSKVFRHGGPYTDLYNKSSREAKKDKRLYTSGELIAFEFDGKKWELIPQTSFYDWLYINALVQNEYLSDEITKYNAFTDIEFNPKKQFSCQARSAAYFVSLSKLNLLRDFISNKKDFLQLYTQKPVLKEQLNLDL